MLKLLMTATLAVAAYTAQAQLINANTFGMMEARQLGPGTMSGRISAIEGVNNDPRIVYVGTAGGGVWKTTNAGATFKPLFDKYCQSIGALAVDQKNPRIIYVGTGESNMRNSVSIGDGFYKSTDAGDNWTRIGGLDSTEHISRIVIDPANSNTIYVAAPGPLWSDSKHRGLYKSTDGGKTFQKILYINEKAGCAEVAVDPTNSNIVYASTWEFRRMPYSFNSGGAGSGFYKSTDGGKTWKEITNGLPEKPFGRIAFAVSPSEPNKLIAIVESKKTGLYISNNGGEEWKRQSATLNIEARPFYFSVIQFDPKNAKRVYRPAYTFSYSDDGGYAFADAPSEGGFLHSDMHALWINPNNTNQMYVGTDGGVYISNDKGANWLFLAGLPVGQFYHVAIDNHQPYYRVYGGLQDNGSWYAPSSHPGGVSVSEWKGIYWGDGFWTQPDLTDPNTAYAEYQGGNMARINISTLKTTPIQPKEAPGDGKLRWNWNTPIVLGAKNPKNLYTGSQYLYKSTDQGRNWTKISPDLTTNDKKKQEQDNSGGLSADVTSAENHCTIFTIAESPLDENIIWVGTDDGNLQYTTDGGKTWTNTSANVAKSGIAAQSWISSIEPSRFDKQTVYATFENHMYGDHKTYCAVSKDMGATWTMFSSSEFSGFAHKIKEDLENKDLLFLGTEMGLFASVDAGKTWFRMKNNIPWYALVRDLQIHPQTHDLVIGTHGRGIIILDDIRPMRTLTSAIAQQDLYIFPQPDMSLEMGKIGGGAAPITGGWVGGNAPGITPIQYYLKDRANGDLKVLIKDAEGKLVQEIPGGKRKGLNRIFWNLRMTPSKVASGGTKVDYAALNAPQVLPGKYNIEITLNGKVYNTPFNVIHDAGNKDLNEAQRKHLYDQNMRLYRAHEQLAGVVEGIAAKQQVLKTAMDKLKNAKTKKLAETYWNKLEEFRSTLLATKQTSVFADEKKLREEISEIYLVLIGQEVAISNLQQQNVDNVVNKVNEAAKQQAALLAETDAKLKAALAKEQIQL
ncbi:MAG: hypothetical protein J0L83_00530 [Chitinophagales bacterium]|nr:hypothetical protein [Chitinophagales bacterium]